MSSRIGEALSYCGNQMQVIDYDQIVARQSFVDHVEKRLLDRRRRLRHQRIHELPHAEESSALGCVNLPQDGGLAHPRIAPQHDNRASGESAQ